MRSGLFQSTRLVAVRILMALPIPEACRMSVRVLFAMLLAAPLFAADPEPTKEFRVKDDRATLGGKPIKLWGLRCGNALYDDTISERHIKNLDNMAAHGINAIGVYIQGSNGGFPDAEAGLNGYTRFGKIKPAVGKRLEELIREADKRGMVVMVGLISPRKDQMLYDEDAIQTAVEETAKWSGRIGDTICSASNKAGKTVARGLRFRTGRAG